MKNSQKRKQLLLVFFSLTFSALGFFKEIKVITYSSLLSKGGYGEWLQEEFSKNTQKKDSLKFQSSKDFSGVLGELRRLKRQNKLNTIDVVMGLNSYNYQQALSESLILPGKAFEKGSYAILVNTQMLEEKNWPKSWKELATQFQKKILVQDPRSSEVGLSWLFNSKVLGNLSFEDSKKLPAKFFPSWSSSFNAFENKAAPLLWTYSTSAAYFECNPGDQKNTYKNLPLDNYPEDKNYIALVANKSHQSDNAKSFINFVMSEKAQSALPLKNWMLPAENVQIPECFKVAKIKNTKDIKEHSHSPIDKAQLQKWLDEWSL